MLARIGFVASILVWTFLRFQAHAADIPSLVQKAKPAVVQVIASDANWTPVRTGTGFFISADGDLLTNFHVIQGAVHISARTDKGAMFVFERVLAESADSDVALLKFQAMDVDFLKIAGSTNAVEGETVLVIGNPEGLQGTVATGIISAFRENRSLIQITAPISPGSSGSPVLDETGKVIGMATLIFKEGQNLNFAISAEVIEAVLRSGTMQASPTSSPAPDEKRASAYYSKALSESDSKDYEGAIKDYSEAIRVKPDFADAYANRGWCYSQLKHYEDAIKDYTEAIRLRPDDSGAYYNRAKAHDGIGSKLLADTILQPTVPWKDISQQWSEAVADYTEAIRLKPDNAEAFFYRGTDYCWLNQSDNAIAAYSEAIRLKPDFAAAYYQRGVVYWGVGKYTDAIADFTESVRLKPDDAEAYYYRGDIFYKLRQYRNAIADWSEMIRLEPGDSRGYFCRGDAYNDLKQYENAVSDYTEGIRRMPNYADAYRNRGRAYEALGDMKRANADFKKAKQLALRKD